MQHLLFLPSFLFTLEPLLSPPEPLLSPPELCFLSRQQTLLKKQQQQEIIFVLFLIDAYLNFVVTSKLKQSTTRINTIK